MTIVYSIAFFIAGVALIIGLFTLASLIVLFFTKVPFVPTPKKNVKLIIDQLNLKPGQIFYDLGCGDGRFLIEAEKHGAKVFGFEISPWAHFRARLNLIIHQSRGKIFYQNFYFRPIADADAVFCFLMDNVMPKVEEKLLKELKPGAIVASYGFKMPNWSPEKIVDLKPFDKKASKIYIYKK
ncbi:MAG: methyltransferase domain-containing protein [Patescibacteria group bacterium]|jgi:SAM-dependent methyltransferase